MIPDFQQFIAVDWSGARGPRLPGLQVAVCAPGARSPQLVHPGDASPWTRAGVVDLITLGARTKGPVLAGFDFGFAFPHLDTGAYFPGAPGNPANASQLWQAVDAHAENAADFYAGPFCAPGKTFAAYLNAPGKRGARFDNRRHRRTEIACRKWTRPSSVFNAVGAGSVGMGSLAGMRMLHALRRRRDIRIAIWPFDKINGADLVLLEIFPRLYVLRSGINPRLWRMPGCLHSVMQHYHTAWRGPRISSEDEFDALVSAAALRSWSRDEALWRPKNMTRAAARLEGWIFGVTG